MNSSSFGSTSHPLGGQSRGGTWRTTSGPAHDVVSGSGISPFISNCLASLPRLKRDLLSLVEGFPSEISFRSEDFLPGSPASLDPVAASSIIFGFFLFWPEGLEKGFVVFADREFVGLVAVSGGEDRFGGKGGGKQLEAKMGFWEGFRLRR
nr:hypothetical protein Iba_chr03bCG10230 [Ipomoea batatas]